MNRNISLFFSTYNHVTVSTQKKIPSGQDILLVSEITTFFSRKNARSNRLNQCGKFEGPVAFV